MKTVRRILETDENGEAHVDLYAGVRTRIEVTVSWRELETGAQAEVARKSKQADLEALAGALADDPIIRPVQPLLEIRLPVE